HAAVPSITSVSPPAAPVGAVVVLVGTNFSPQKNSNMVHFGAVHAAVISASSTSLTVVVPAGAAYSHVRVTVGGLIGSSKICFTPTFPSSGVFDALSFYPALDVSISPDPRRIRLQDLDGDGRAD